MPPGRDLRLSDFAADPHRRSPGRDGQGRRAGALRVHQRRVGIRRHERRHRRLGRRRPQLHGHRQPGAAVHGRGGVQRLRPRTSHCHDGGQSRHRRPDQHLERPFGRALDARLRLDPAVRRDQPGGPRPAHPGLPPRRGIVAADHGLHGRLHPHARLRTRRPAQPGPGRCLPAALRAAPGTRSPRAGVDRRHGRPRGILRGPLPGSCQADAGAGADAGLRRRVRGGIRPRQRRPDAHLPRRGRRDDDRRHGLGARHHQGRGRRDARGRPQGRRARHHLLPALSSPAMSAWPSPASASTSTR